MNQLSRFAISPQVQHVLHLQPLRRAHLCQVQLSGMLNMQRLQAAVNLLLQQHEVLRSELVNVSELGLTLQQINEPFSVEVSRCDTQPDLVGLAAADCFSVYVWQQADDDWRLLITLPASLIDTESCGQLVAQLAMIYELGEITDPDIVQYADYSQWQLEMSEQQTGSEGQMFWAQVAEKHVNDIQCLPLCIPNHDNHRLQANLTLPAVLCQQLNSVAGQLELEIRDLYRFAWGLLLQQHCTGSPFTVWSPVTHAVAELAGAIGRFEKWLPFPWTECRHQSLAEAAALFQAEISRHENFCDAYQCQDDYQAFGFCFESFDRHGGPTLSWQQVEFNSGLHIQQLLLQCQSSSSTVVLQLSGQQGMYDTKVLNLLLSQFVSLLQNLVAHPSSQLLASLNFHNGADQDFLQLRIDKNQADPDLRTMLLSQAELKPNRVALQCGNRSISYGALFSAAWKISHHLQRRGVGVGVPVGVYLSDPVAAVSAMLGIMLAGAIYVPLDVAYPQQRLRHMVNEAGVNLVLTEPHEDVAKLEGLPLVYPSSLSDSASSTRQMLSLLPDQPAYIIFTSGSTGKPKGVLVSQQNLAASTMARLHYYQSTDVKFLLLSSFSFDSSIAGLFWTLLSGGTLCFLDMGNLKDVDSILLAAKRMAVTHTLMVPSLYQTMLQLGFDQHVPSIQVVIVAGESCSHSLAKLHQERLPQTLLVNEYGPTECTVWASVAVLAGPDGLCERVTIGRPIPYYDIQLLNELCQPVPVGTVGEICIGGPGVSLGYTQRPDSSASQFIPDAMRHGQRLYRTGDQARWLASGELEFLGRIDEQVKIRGFRIELGDIESTLAQVSGIQQVAVVVNRQQNNQTLVCYFIAGTQMAVPAEALRTALQLHLPAYMHPDHYIGLSEMPLTPNGKVDRQLLANRDLQHFKLLPLQTNTEQRLAALWNELLPDVSLGGNSEFFKVGGHSLLAMQLIPRIRHQFAIETTVQMIFDYPVLSEQAMKIERLSDTMQAGFDIIDI